MSAFRDFTAIKTNVSKVWMFSNQQGNGYVLKYFENVIDWENAYRESLSLHYL